MCALQSRGPAEAHLDLEAKLNLPVDAREHHIVKDALRGFRCRKCGMMGECEDLRAVPCEGIERLIDQEMALHFEADEALAAKLQQEEARDRQRQADESLASQILEEEFVQMQLLEMQLELELEEQTLLALQAEQESLECPMPPPPVPQRRDPVPAPVCGAMFADA